MEKKLNSMRCLDSLGIRYEPQYFPATLLSAPEVAKHLGVAASQVYKTLVLVLPTQKPILVMVAGDRDIHLKHLAQCLGEKRLRMATQKDAEAWTGLQVGGIAALALQHKHFPTYLDQAAAFLERLFVSAGQRGVDLCLSVADLLRATRATFVEATVPASTEPAAGMTAQACKLPASLDSCRGLGTRA